jgi:hypothetical protein
MCVSDAARSRVVRSPHDGSPPAVPILGAIGADWSVLFALRLIGRREQSVRTSLPRPGMKARTRMTHNTLAWIANREFHDGTR